MRLDSLGTVVEGCQLNKVHAIVDNVNRPLHDFLAGKSSNWRVRLNSLRWRSTLLRKLNSPFRLMAQPNTWYCVLRGVQRDLRNMRNSCFTNFKKLISKNYTNNLFWFQNGSFQPKMTGFYSNLYLPFLMRRLTWERKHFSFRIKYQELNMCGKTETTQ